MSDQDQPLTPLQELHRAAQALDGGAFKLAERQREFDGQEDADGVWQPGPKLLWLELLDEELAALAEEYEQAEKRPPNQAVMEARARARAKRKQPGLWADYHRLAGEIAAMQKWVSAKKQSVSALQSVLKSETTLDGPQPQWSRRAA